VGRRGGIKTVHPVQFSADAEDQSATNCQPDKEDREDGDRYQGPVGGQHHVNKSMDIGDA